MLGERRVAERAAGAPRPILEHGCGLDRDGPRLLMQTWAGAAGEFAALLLNRDLEWCFWIPWVRSIDPISKSTTSAVRCRCSRPTSRLWVPRSSPSVTGWSASVGMVVFVFTRPVGYRAVARRRGRGHRSARSAPRRWDCDSADTVYDVSEPPRLRRLSLHTSYPPIWTPPCCGSSCATASDAILRSCWHKTCVASPTGSPHEAVPQVSTSCRFHH
jgi:hypothetical protein